MTHLSLFDRSLGELARNIPGAIEVFHKHGIDFCCAGDQSLRQALGGTPLELEQVASRLAALASMPEPPLMDWQASTAQEIIQHIVSQYHQGHRRQIPTLVRLAQTVQATHADHPLCPTGLSGLLMEMGTELDTHMREEEDSLFPLMSDGADPLTLPAISELKAEHSAQGEVLDRVLAAAHHLAMPADACNTWRALLQGLSDFKRELMQHIHLENNILFEGLYQQPKHSSCGVARCGCNPP